MSSAGWWRAVLIVCLTAAPLFARAAEVFVCEETDRVGFGWTGKAMEHGNLPGARLTLSGTFPTTGGKTTGAVLAMEGLAAGFYVDCVVPFRGLAPMSCTNGAHTMVLDRDSGRFSLARQFGWVFGDTQGTPNEDTFTIGWGTCTRAPETN